MVKRVLTSRLVLYSLYLHAFISDIHHLKVYEKVSHVGMLDLLFPYVIIICLLWRFLRILFGEFASKLHTDYSLDYYLKKTRDSGCITLVHCSVIQNCLSHAPYNRSI